MSNHLYTFGAFLVAAGLVFGAMQYVSKTPDSLSTLKNNTAMLATVGVHAFSLKNTQEERTVIDVRTKEEYDAGHIDGAILIDISDPAFSQKINMLQKDASYSIYCRSGNRSGRALSFMEENGFSDVINLDGGIIAWKGNGNNLCTDC